MQSSSAFGSLRFRGSNTENQPSHHNNLLYRAPPPLDNIDQEARSSYPMSGECVVDLGLLHRPCTLNTKRTNQQDKLCLRCPSSFDSLIRDALSEVMTHIAKQPQGITDISLLAKTSKAFQVSAKDAAHFQKNEIVTVIQNINNHIANLKLKAQPASVEELLTYTLIKQKPRADLAFAAANPLKISDMLRYRDQLTLHAHNNDKLRGNFKAFSAMVQNKTHQEANGLVQFNTMMDTLKVRAVIQLAHDVVNSFLNAKFISNPIIDAISELIRVSNSLNRVNAHIVLVPIYFILQVTPVLLARKLNLVDRIIQGIKDIRQDRGAFQLELLDDSFDPRINYTQSV